MSSQQNQHSGPAYIFTRTAGTWPQDQVLLLGDGAPAEYGFPHRRLSAERSTWTVTWPLSGRHTGVASPENSPTFKVRPMFLRKTLKPVSSNRPTCLVTRIPFSARSSATPSPFPVTGFSSGPKAVCERAIRHTSEGSNGTKPASG